MDCSLATTTELIEELSKRYEAAIFTGVNFDQEVSVSLHGSALLCSGLLTNAQNEILYQSFSSRDNEK